MCRGTSYTHDYQSKDQNTCTWYTRYLLAKKKVQILNVASRISCFWVLKLIRGSYYYLEAARSAGKSSLGRREKIPTTTHLKARSSAGNTKRLQFPAFSRCNHEEYVRLQNFKMAATETSKSVVKWIGLPILAILLLFHATEAKGKNVFFFKYRLWNSFDLR